MYSILVSEHNSYTAGVMVCLIRVGGEMAIALCIGAILRNRFRTFALENPQ